MAIRPRSLPFLLAAAALLAGCAVEVQNRQPAQELAQAARPPGSVYTGWRVFQDRCAGCHGEAGTGSDKAPDLLARSVDAMTDGLWLQMHIHGARMPRCDPGVPCSVGGWRWRSPATTVPRVTVTPWLPRRARCAGRGRTICPSC